MPLVQLVLVVPNNFSIDVALLWFFRPQKQTENKSKNLTILEKLHDLENIL